jgi:hypothetical protein
MQRRGRPVRWWAGAPLRLIHAAKQPFHDACASLGVWWYTSRLPGRPDGLADHQRRVRIGRRTEFLRAPGVDFGEIQIAFLIDAHPVHVPEGPRPLAAAAPGIEIAAVYVVFTTFGVSLSTIRRYLSADMYRTCGVDGEPVAN